MKIKLLILFVLLSISQIYAEQVIYKTTVNNLRLRKGPTVNDKIIRNLKFEEEVILLLKGKSDKINNVSGNWIKVKTLNNEIGWCFDAYLKIVENPKKMKLNELSYNILIYADKKGKTVTIYKEDIKIKSKQKLFEYEEDYKAELTGNYWEGMSPSISLNNDKTLFAYTDINGLNLYNLLNNSNKLLIKKISIKPKEVYGYDWSIKEVNGAYSLAKPIWIRNNILFEMADYEGSRIGVYNLKTNDVKYLKKENSYFTILSNNNDLAIYNKSDSVDSARYGLFISNKDLFDIKDISGENMYFSDAYYSNNKKYITYNYTPFFKKHNINMIYSIEKNEHTMINGTENYKFSSILLDDNVNIIYIQTNKTKEMIINKINYKNKNEEIILKIDHNNKIIKCENPKLFNDRYYCFETIIGEKKSLEKIFYIVDLKLKEIYYTKKFDNYFTTIIGLQ